jgi:predicted AAA+ superfamily ATPase
MNIPKTILQRPVYLRKIKLVMNKPEVKVLTGHRRVGKSYLLYQLMELIQSENPKANIIYINKEDLEFDSIGDFRQLHDYVKARLSGNEKNYIFVDEVQLITDFHKAIKSLALDSNNDIYITGSNSNMLAADVANELGGRYRKITVYSLSYLEFLDFHKLESNDEALEKYMRYGGLPYLINLQLNEENVDGYLHDVLSTIVLKDVVARKQIHNVDFLEQLLRFIAANTGCLFSVKSISDFIKHQKSEISPAQVIEYVKALTDAFIIQHVRRYDIVGKRIFEVGEKYYFENLGIRNAVAGYKLQDKAKRLENVVYNHLLFCGYCIKVGALATEEIDFVCTRSGETLYVQVSIEISRPTTIAREFGNLLKIKDNYPKMVVTADRSFANTYEGVQHINILDFLTTVK